MLDVGQGITRCWCVSLMCVGWLSASLSGQAVAQTQAPSQAQERRPEKLLRPPTFTFPEVHAKAPLVWSNPAQGRSRQEPSATGTVKSQPNAARLALSPDRSRRADSHGRKLGSGRATWYEHPGRTASGEIYNPNSFTAAHHTLPLGSRVRVVNTRNSRSVVVRITDRTNERTNMKRPYAIDLSRRSARAIGIESVGSVALYDASE